jgi:hypothetical protein
LPSSPEDGDDGLVDDVCCDGVGVLGDVVVVVVLGAVVCVGGVGGAGGVLVCVWGVVAGAGAGVDGVVCVGGAVVVVVSAGGCSFQPVSGDCGGLDGVVVAGLDCPVCVVSFHPGVSPWANELAAPAVRSQTNVHAIAMPSRSGTLLTGAGLTWDRNTVLLPSR